MRNDSQNGEMSGKQYLFNRNDSQNGEMTHKMAFT